MEYSNTKLSIDAVEKLSVKKDEKVLEIGVGNGIALVEIIKKTDNDIFGVEISEEFRKNLTKLKLPANVMIMPNDAKDLGPTITNGSIDKLLAINVVYFLSPLDDYLTEFYRVLKKKAYGFLICKFGSIEDFDDHIAPNKQEEKIVIKLKNSGFSVTSSFVDLGDDRSKYTLIKFTKV
jgi:cyclopropane fatty-acyl-phospholipid synthase-like methyltransferase